MSSLAMPAVLLLLAACAAESECCEGCVELILDNGTRSADLTGVECVVGDLWLQQRSSLEDAQDLRIVTGSLSIVDNPELMHLLDLKNLRQVGGHLAIARNASLRSANTGGGSMSIAGELTVGDNPGLTELDLGVDAIGSELVVANNDVIRSISLPTLERAGGVTIAENPALERIDLAQLAETEQLALRRNPMLSEIGSFAQLRAAGLVELRESSVVVLDGFEALKELDSLFVSNNEQLEEVAGFPSLAALERLGIGQNPQLVRVAGLERVSEVSSWLTVVGNPTLSALQGLRPSHAGNVMVVANTALTEEELDKLLDGLEVDGVLKLGGNDGETIPYPDPCPWMGDGICDAAVLPSGTMGTGLCETDADCG